MKLNIEEPYIKGVLTYKQRRYLQLWLDEWYGPIYQCKNCGKVEIWDNFNYCPICGAEIEWEGE